VTLGVEVTTLGIEVTVTRLAIFNEAIK